MFPTLSMVYTRASMNSVFLFTGENTYALQAEKKRWAQNFREKHGESNYMTFNGERMTLRSLLDEVSVAPFIAEKRLIILDCIPSLTKEELALLLQQMHPQILLVFVEPKLDKRLSSTKELLKIAEVKEFPLLPPVALQKWVEEFLREHQTSIEPDAKALLLTMCGSDQQFLSQELLKLSLLAGAAPITKKHVDAVSMVTGEQEVWHLMDMIGAGNIEEALTYCQGLLERGEGAQGLWSRLLWMLTNLVQVAVVTMEGETNIANITKKTGVPFPSVRGLLPIARRIKKSHLEAIVSWTAEADVCLKQGSYRATAEEPEELEMLIDRFILSFSA